MRRPPPLSPPPITPQLSRLLVVGTYVPLGVSHHIIFCSLKISRENTQNETNTIRSFKSILATRKHHEEEVRYNLLSRLHYLMHVECVHVHSFDLLLVLITNLTSLLLLFTPGHDVVLYQDFLAGQQGMMFCFVQYILYCAIALCIYQDFLAFLSLRVDIAITCSNAFFVIKHIRTVLPQYNQRNQSTQ